MPVSLLSTKLFIPYLNSRNVTRPKLIEKLNRGRESKLILVSAPAGYGKTTLLAEWITHLAIPVGWVSLDKQDNDPGFFFSYLFASLRKAGIEINESIIPDNKRYDPEKSSSLISLIINQVSSSSKPIYLVLDDFHQITNQEIHRGISYLLENLPQNMHIIIASRSDPLLKLAKLRAQGELIEIRANDLRFTPEEVGQYLNKSMALGLSFDDISIVTEKTEGWIVGLQLAAISLQRNSDRQKFIQNFAGDNRYIADYLIDEVLSSQPEYIGKFLLYTSLLDRLSAPLCDAVTGRNDSIQILSQLENENLFLVPLDDKRNWFRYHYLFKDLLRKRLQQLPEETQFQLYQRASGWFEQHQLFSEAVKLSLFNNDADRVTELMESYLLAIVSTSELVEMNRLLKSLPEKKISDDPWLALALAWGLAYKGDLEDAKRLLEKASEGIKSGSETLKCRVGGRILVLKAYLAGTNADYPQSIQFAQEALGVLPENDLSIRSFTILIIGNDYRFQGKLADSIEYHQSALNLSKRAKDTYLSVVIMSRLIDIYRIAGKVNLSLKICHDAQELIRSHQNKIGVTTFIEGYLSLRMSSTYYERNELAKALKFNNIGFELAKQWGGYDSLSLGYFTFCRIYQALEDPESAKSYLKEFINDYPFTERFQYKTAMAYAAELDLNVGDIQAAHHWMCSTGLKFTDDIQFLDYKFYDVLAQVLFSQKKYKQAKVLLEKLLRIADESGAVEYEIRTRTRMALIYHREKKENLALEFFTKALNLAASGGYVRVILDFDANIVNLISIAIKNGVQVNYCKQILENMHSQKQRNILPSQFLYEPLSSREAEVLGWIADGYTNKEIAKVLYLSLSTIKTHARNIYSKLGVKNRTEAVARARQLGLLKQEQPIH